MGNGNGIFRRRKPTTTAPESHTLRGLHMQLASLAAENERLREVHPTANGEAKRRPD